MAHSTLPVLTHPHFPQVLGQALAAEVRRVERMLGTCLHEDTEGYGPNMVGWSCREQAVVSDLNNGYGLCEFHFRQANLGVDRGPLPQLREAHRALRGDICRGDLPYLHSDPADEVQCQAPEPDAEAHRG